MTVPPGGPPPGDSAPPPRRRRGATAALSLVVPLLFLVVGVAVRDTVPETWDEQFDQDIGRHYLHHWRESGVAGLEERFIPLQRHYGPAFAVVVVAVHELLHDRLGLIANPVASHHMATLGATCVMLWCTFWIAARQWGPRAGLVASLLLALLPQLVAHSQNNLKDMPLAAAFTAAVLLFVEAERRHSLRLGALAGVMVGVAYAVKPNGLFVWAVVAPWLVLARPLDGPRSRWLAALSSASVAAAVGTVLLVWPYYRGDPVTRFLETLATFRHHVYNEYVFYLGEHYPAHDVPWHFPYVMIGVYSPILVLLLVVVSGFLLVRSWRRRSEDRALLSLLWSWLAVPPTLHVLSGAAKLDGLRHHLTVLPALALLATAGAQGTWDALGPTRPRLRLGAAAGLALWFAFLVQQNVAYHPYQNVFFNCSVGGTKGARELFELDYWGVSLAAGAEWLNANAPDGSRVWLTVPGQHFFKIDRSRLHFVGGLEGRPSYKVNLIRGLLRSYDTEDDYLHPMREPVFSVTVAGADLLQIFEYPEHRDVAAGSRLSPSRQVLPGAAPGLLARLFDASFSAPLEPPWQVDRVELDCAGNVCSGRTVGLRLEGYLRAEVEGEYRFEVHSDDDAILLLESRPVATNASLATSRNSVRLSPGLYAIRVDLRNRVGPACLRVSWGRVPETATTVLSTPALLHVPPAD